MMHDAVIRALLAGRGKCPVPRAKRFGRGYARQKLAAFMHMAGMIDDRKGRIGQKKRCAGQGKQPVDMGGYYHPDFDKTSAAMRPSETFNAALALIGEVHDA